MDIRSGSGMLGRGRQLARPAVAVLLLAWFALVAAYAWSINSVYNYISRDQWHFLPLVDHYLSGTLDWHELWQSHTEHVKPGYYLLFLLNARYFGLDMFLETMAGIVLLGVATWVLLRNMDKQREQGAPMPALALLTAGVVLMSFNQWANYGYGLLSLGGFGGMLMQFLVMLGFARLLAQGLDLKYGVLLVLALILSVLGFSGARGPALVGACFAAVVAAWWLMPEARRRILRQGGVFLGLGAIAIGIYLALLHHPTPLHEGLGGSAAGLLSHPLGAFNYVSGILGESMLALSLAAGSRALPVLTWLLPLCAYLLLGWCLWRYFRAAHWRTSWVPLMLIAYSALFTLEILVGRYGADSGQTHGSTVPRYVFDAHLWLVGCAWILGLDWRARRSEMSATLQRALPAVLLTAMLALELYNLRLADRFRPYAVRGGARVALQLRAAVTGSGSVDDLPAWECPSKELCQQGLVILEKHHLSFARDAADPEVLKALQQIAQPVPER